MGVKEELNLQEHGEELQIDGASPSALITPIQGFYTDAKVLITGATGFLGKALAEKLLRSCHNIDTVYYLVRAKRGVPVSVRHEKLLKSSVFDRIREEKPELLKKLMPITGDVADADLGLSPQDRFMLSQNVHVVFHSAATVRFDEKITDAYVLNTAATIKVLDLCKSMKNLKVLVYVSTAYSNSDKQEILEEVYPTPAKLEDVIEICKIQDDSEQERSVKKIQGGHPNTYTLTKAMAEAVVNEHAKELPVCIVRPSIVTGSVKEPMPGWIDNFSAVSGIMVEIGRGTLKSIICEQENVMDVIPVDFVVNTMIAAAWRTSTQGRTEKATVYNCTSGELNPISWHAFGRLTEKYSLKYPSKFVTFYPGFEFRTNMFMHVLVTFFYQLLPALILDIILFCTRQRTFMVSLVLKFIAACRTGCFFSLHGWHFHSDNMVELKRLVSKESSDAADFPFDVQKINWDSYVENYVVGLRKFALRDPLTSLPVARSKLNRIYWISTAFTWSMGTAGVYLASSFISTLF